MKSRILSLIVVLGVLLSSCTKNFDALNTDPNNPSSANPEWLLTAAQKRAMDEMWDEWMNGRTGMYYAQYWAATSYTEESRYQIRESVNNAYWTGVYAGALADLVQLKKLNDANPTDASANQNAIADIMIAWQMQIVGDFYGAAPMADALQGIDNPSPKFDDLPSIYTQCLDLIDNALANLDASKPSFGAGDVMYGGDVNAWKKFANSVKLRIGMRMADVDAAKAATVVAEAAAAGVMETNADNAVFSYQSAAPNNNPQNENWKTRQDFCPSEVLVNYMLGVNDPRLSAYAAPALNSGNYVGMPYGLTNADATAIPNDDVSMPSATVLAASAPGIYMDAAETHFALAEAVERGFISGDAATHYAMGITASMEFWGVTDATVISDYITNNPYDSGDWKNVLGTQKWLALYMQGLQGFFEYNRLDFKQPGGADLFVMPADGSPFTSLDGDLASTTPKRMTFPIDEYDLNSTNAASAQTYVGGSDSKANKVWWDVN